MVVYTSKEQKKKRIELSKFWFTISKYHRIFHREIKYLT